MRDYARVAPQFWTGETGRAIRALVKTEGSSDPWTVANYLMSCPSASMIGLYRLPMVTLCHDTGITEEGASKALRSLEALGFCARDEETDLIWVPEMARCQIGEDLKPGDNRIKGVARELAIHRKSRFYDAFLARYATAFRLDTVGLTPSPSEGPSESLRSQDQDQDQDQDQEHARTPRARELPYVGLVQPPGRNVAVPGRVPLPATLFAEFVTKLGGDENAARARVQAWAIDVLGRYAADKPIPGSANNFAFWRQRADEDLFGPVQPQVDPRRRAGLSSVRRPAADDAWSQALEHIATSVPSNQFQTWFSRTRIHEDRGDEIVVTVLDAGVGQSLERHFAPAIERAIEAIGRHGTRVTFIAEDAAAKVSA